MWITPCESRRVLKPNWESTSRSALVKQHKYHRYIGRAHVVASPDGLGHTHNSKNKVKEKTRQTKLKGDDKTVSSVFPTRQPLFPLRETKSLFFTRSKSVSLFFACQLRSIYKRWKREAVEPFKWFLWVCWPAVLQISLHLRRHTHKYRSLITWTARCNLPEHAPFFLPSNRLTHTHAFSGAY